MAKVKVIKETEDIKDKKKKKKIHFSWAKLFVWVALLAMVGAAILAILSPLLYGTN